MRVLSLCLLFFINYSYAICDYGFDRSMNRQFVNMIKRHFTTYEMYVQREVTQVVDGSMREGWGRKEMLQHLIDAGYLAVEGSSEQNRLFSDILSESPKRGIQTIKENPDSLYEGTLLNLPPFFLAVFVGEKKVMQFGIDIDRRLVNSRNPLQEVPLHYTLDPDMATGLFFHKAKPNEPDKKGRVPLYNSRDPETVRVMLYYNADPMVRDRSGTPLIRYHREQVGDQEIVGLLEQARESKRTRILKIVRNTTEPVVDQKTEEEIRAEQEERRLAEERKRAEAERAEAEKMEKRRLGEEMRIARQAEAKEANRRVMKERKSELLSALADLMAITMMAKALVKRVSHQTVDLGIFSNVGYTLRRVQTRSSNIIIYEKEFEETFEKELHEAISSIERSGKSVTEYEQEVRGIVGSKTNALENMLLAKLKEEIDHYSIGKIKRILNKTEDYYVKIEKMMGQVMKIKKAQDTIIGDVIRETNSHPETRSVILSRERGDLVRAILLR